MLGFNLRVTSWDVVHARIASRGHVPNQWQPYLECFKRETGIVGVCGVGQVPRSGLVQVAAATVVRGLAPGRVRGNAQD